MKLKIAKDFELPIEAVTQTFAVLAKRGVGKTHNGSVMAEEMLKAGQQIIAIDPTGAWWGLRSGFPIVIFGGEHADVPIEETAGEVIAEAIVGSRISAVIDLCLFRKGQARRFITAFLETLYRLNREPVHLFVDEADDICPQKPFGDEAQMVGAMEDVVKRGRKKGIGCTLITQRPADLAKQVLTQCEILVAMRLVHPRDIKAIEEWVNVHAEPALAKTMIASLPSLPIGAAWFWAPGWGDIFQRVQVRHRETFDSSATPKPGETAAKPKRMAEIDLAALGERIKSTVEKAKANDPAALKRRIRELETHLQKPAVTIDNGAVERARGEGVRIAKHEFTKSLAILKERLQKSRDLVDVAIAQFSFEPTTPVAKTHEIAPKLNGTNPGPAVFDEYPTSKLNKADRLILTALAHYPQGRSKVQTALLAGYAHSGGSFNNAVSSCRSAGWIEGGSDLLRITRLGVDAVGPVDPLPTGVDLLRQWQRQVGKPEREILDVLFDVFPKPLTKDGIADRTPSKYQAMGGSFNNAICRLRTLELIKGRREMVLSEDLVQ